MKTGLIFIFIILFSCSSNQQQQQEKQENQARIYKTLRDGQVNELEELFADEEIVPESYMYNVLAQNCSPEMDSLYRIKAKFLLDKGVKIEEKSFKNIKGPLVTSISNGCFEMTKFFLDNLESKDIASASGGYSAISREALTGIEGNNIDLEAMDKLLGNYLSTLLPITFCLIETSNRNEAYCRKGQQDNCEARTHLEAEQFRTVDEALNAVSSKYCATHSLIQDKKDLMEGQLEFGRQTGVASPQTYDQHAQEAQYLMTKQSQYNQMMRETFQIELKPEDCL